MHKHTALRAIAPLRTVFAGGLLCILNFQINRFDILNNTVGAVFIAVGVFQLGRLSVNDRYATVMLFARVISVLYVFESIRAQVTMATSGAIEILVYIFSLACLAAAILFCLAILWLCQEAGLPRASRSWAVTTILIGVFYGLPLAALTVMGMFATVLSPALFDFSAIVPPGLAVPFIILIIIVLLLTPLIHFFISTSRMKREAEAANG
jgi:hypothetical protein